MFGDIVSGKSANVSTNIRNFVKNISRGGGYIFEQLGKKFDDLGNENAGVDAQYHTIGHVPDYKKQYVRQPGGTQYVRKEEDEKSAEPSDLYRCIIEPTIGNEGYTTPSLNYNSALYYYTTCMVFGLVDSVQKNLNIKS